MGIKNKTQTFPVIWGFIFFVFFFFPGRIDTEKNNKEKMDGWKLLGFGGKYIFGIEMRKSTRVREKT